MMSDSLIKIKSFEEEKFVEVANSSEENNDPSGSPDPDPDHDQDPDPDPDPDPETTSKHIPKDVVFSDILTRVPVKSLLRFSSVSKEWKSSICRDPYFIKRHYSRSLTQPEAACLLVLVKVYKSPQVNFLSIGDLDGGNSITTLLRLPTNTDYMISNNINGLSCFHPFNGSISVYENSAFVYSPTLRELDYLPSIPTKLQASYFFGVDPLTQKFKVLSFQTNRYIRKSFEIEVDNRFLIIGNDDGAWREIYYDFPFDIDDNYIAHSILFGQGVCVNGFIHWILFSKCILLTFCLKNEMFGFMSLPKGLVPQKGVFFGLKRLIIVGGCLTIEDVQQSVTTNLKVLWILEDYENQVWVKKVIFIPYLFDVSQRSLYLLSSAHIGTLFLAQVAIHSRSFQQVMYCDMEAKSLRRFQLPQFSNGDEIRVVTTYSESLLSVHHDV